MWQCGKLRRTLGGRDVEHFRLARDDLGSEARLIAHIVATGAKPKANELRDFLKSKLPAYAIPSGFFFLDRMPLTPHGKVDRSALLATRGKVFTLQNVDNLIACTRLGEFRTRE